MFRHSVHFVVYRRPMWPEIVGCAANSLTDSKISSIDLRAYESWVHLTFAHLKVAGFDVTISDYPRIDAINITNITRKNIIYRFPEPFYVVCRADGPDSIIANFVVDQNDIRRETSGRSWVPNWPQPGIIQRDLSRGNVIAVAAFKGYLPNIDRSIIDEETLSKLNSIGIEFRIDDFDAQGQCRWHDYSDVDIVIAVRNLTKYWTNTKPAAKLVNAWMADVPALLGPEPAYRTLRRSEDDYIEVRSGRDIFEAVARLKENPDVYRRMVENGRRRRHDFSKERTLDRWIALLNGPITTAFERWREKSRLERRIRRRIGFVGEEIVRQHHRYAIQRGPKLLDP